MTKKRRRDFTTGEIANQCGISFSAITKWINRGKINFPWRVDQQVSFEDFILFLSQHDLQNRPNLTAIPPTVLVIDDESNVVNSIGRVFHSLGFKVLSSDNGFKAGLLISQERPQIITLDLNLENVDGYDILEMIKKLKLENKVWIVVISGESEDCLEKSIELGADCFLKKPFSKNDLEKIIKKFYPDQNVGENHERSSVRRAF